MALNDTTAAATGGTVQGIVLHHTDLYLIIIVVLLVVGSFQWVAFLHAKFDCPRRFLRDEESVRSSKRKTILLTLPLAVVNFYRVLAFRTTVGFRSYVFNLAELFAAVGYVALLFVWTLVTKSDPDGEPLRLRSRAASLAASQLLFVTVLGTKNNIVSLITRISADRLNVLHRVAARACLILVGIHVLGRGNIFAFNFKFFGLIAVLFFAALAVVSLRPVRERTYELFFYFHLVAIIVIMVATILHINLRRPTGLTSYIWLSLVIWAADRLMRVGRLVYFNLAYFTSSQRRGTLDATTELLSDSLVRVRFRRPDNFHWSPGQFAYLVMPSVSRLPFEAHPFSIANVDSVLFAPDAKVAEDSYGKELVFFIGVKNGFTRRLKDVAARGERAKVYIDGPYGEGVDMGCYDTSLLIAGGTGITFALPALLSVIESVRNRSGCCRRVVLIWSIRDADFLNWVSESLNKAIRFAPPELKVDIQVFLTKGRPYLSSTAQESQTDFEAMHSSLVEDHNPFLRPSSSDDLAETKFPPSWLKVTSGRPNLEHILDEEINAASGKVSVSVCGPNAMAKVVREALRFSWSGLPSPLNGGPSVTLHVESFGYA